MEIQALLPQAKLTCLNKAGYEYVQMNTSEYGIDVARQHKINLYCNASDHSVILPSVILFDGLQTNPLSFKNESIDLIVSHHALNEGMILSTIINTDSYITKLF
jgi:hypothetical protein